MQDNNLYDILSGPNSICLSEDCAPDSVYTMYGALTKITYPTGGHSTIEYEQNVAGKRVNRTMDQGVFVEDNRNFSVGGVRVNKITDCDKDNCCINSTSYSYVNPDGSSSGTIQWIPRYALKRDVIYSREEADVKWDFGMNWHLDTLPNTVHQCEFLALNSHGVYSFKRESSIGYSHVNEIKADSSRIEYDFIDNADYGDIFGGRPSGMYPKAAMTIPWNSIDVGSVTGCLSYYTQCDSNSYQTISNILSPITENRSCIRGKIKEKREYDSNNLMRSKTTFGYIIRSVASRPQMHDVLFGFAPYVVSFVSPLLVSTETTEYFGDGSNFATKKLMAYNTDGQLSCQEIYYANKRKSMTDYNYYDTSDGVGCAHFLRQKDCLTFGEDSDDPITVSSFEYFYASDNCNPNPIRIVMSVPGGASKELNFIYDNNSFRLTEVRFPGGAYYKYLWDGNNVYIVEKETNGSAMTDTYWWKDLVGLASHTNPYGNTESYTYDALNRLKEVYTDEDKTVEYEYNVINH